MAALIVSAACLFPAAQASAGTKPRVLVFSKTAGFRHPSIPIAVDAVRRLGARHGFVVDATEDGSAFTGSNLRRYAAVVFLSTTGDVLDPRPAGGVRALHPRGRRLRWSPRRRRHGIRLAVLRRPGRRLLPVPPADSALAARDGQGGRPPPSLHPPSVQPVDPHRRVVRLPSQPAGRRPRARDPRRGHLRGCGDGHGPPDRLVPRLPGRALLVHGRRAHSGVVRRAGLPATSARRHPLGRRPGEGRLPRHRRLRLPEGHPERPSRRADVPCRASRPPRAAHHAAGRGAHARPAHGAQHGGRAARRLRAR